MFYSAQSLSQIKFNLQILLAIQLMKDQPVQTKSKKWVDYSDSDSSEQGSHQHTQNNKSKHEHKQPQSKEPKKKITYVPTKDETNKELDKLDDLRQAKVEEVWLDMYSQNIAYLEEQMNFLKKKAKKGGNIVSVYAGKQRERYEINVFINVAYDYIEKGYDKYDYIKVNVASKNFEKRRNNRPPPLKQKESFKEETKDKTNEAKDLQKKKYVDKQTGKAPEIVKKSSDNAPVERKYTKEQAEKKGQMIGEFRNKQAKVEEKAVNQEKPVQQPKEKQQTKKSEPVEIKKVEVAKKEQQKPAQPKKQKETAKKEKKPKNKTKSSNPFEDLLDL